MAAQCMNWDYFLKVNVLEDSRLPSGSFGALLVAADDGEASTSWRCLTPCWGRVAVDSSSTIASAPHSQTSDSTSTIPGFSLCATGRADENEGLTGLAAVVNALGEVAPEVARAVPWNDEGMETEPSPIARAPVEEFTWIQRQWCRRRQHETPGDRTTIWTGREDTTGGVMAVLVDEKLAIVLGHDSAPPLETLVKAFARFTSTLHKLVSEPLDPEVDFRRLSDQLAHCL
eukprot:Filipodium_phascolosomae@DN3553_c0_g1_i1.p1